MIAPEQVYLLPITQPTCSAVCLAATNCTGDPVNQDPTSTNDFVCGAEGAANGSVCTGSCKSGFSGQGWTATCSGGTWSYNGSCTANGGCGRGGCRASFAVLGMSL